jgi:ferredoxin-NADP reductase
MRNAVLKTIGSEYFCRLPHTLNASIIHLPFIFPSRCRIHHSLHIISFPMIAPHILRGSIKPKAIVALVIGTGAGSAWYYTSNARDESRIKHLNPSSFVSYTLVSKDSVSSTSSIFRLRPQVQDPRTSQIIGDAFRRGIWSVQFKQPQLQIARNYTPLPDVEGRLEDGELQVLIRREEGGEVSNYLHDLPERSTISIRGPFEECGIPTDVTNVVFLAGGTGIAPALQVAGLLKHRHGLQMHILWANRRREDCVGGQDERVPEPKSFSSWFSSAKSSAQKVIPVAQSKGLTVQLLETLQSQIKPGQLSIDYFVDEEKKFVNLADVARLLGVKRNGKALILISGPDGFVEYWAGKKEWRMGQETQGVLGGQLAKMDRKGWEVIKI